MNAITVPHRRRLSVGLIAAPLAVLAACGGATSGGSGNTPGASARSPSAVAYSACMRAHGVPRFPDPSSDGQVPKVAPQQLGISSSQLQGAQHACQDLYPNSDGSLNVALHQCEETGDCPAAIVQQVMTQLRSFSQCMRARGVPLWPDPVLDSQGRPEIYIRPWKIGFDPDTPQGANTMQGCQAAMHPVVAPPLAVYLPPRGQGG